MEKKLATNKILWVFAIGQLGWSTLSGIFSNWLVYYYMPGDTLIDKGHTLFITQTAVFLGFVTIIGAITALGRLFDAFTDPWIASLPIAASIGSAAVRRSCGMPPFRSAS